MVADLHNHLGSTAPAPAGQPSQTGSKYHITINSAQGVAIGDQAQVNQYASGTADTAASEAAATTPATDALYQRILDRFDLEELRTLCFKLGVDFDDLRGEGRAGKARELVKLMQRRGQIDRLQQAIAGNG